MKKFLFGYSVIGILSILNISLLWKTIYLNQKIDILLKTYENTSYNNFELVTSEIKDSLLFLNNQVILDTLFNLKDEKDNDVPLKNIIKGFNRVLIFRYSESDCFTCYDTFFETLKNNMKEIGCEKIIFWGKFRNKREWLNFLKFNPYFCKAFYSTGDVLLPIEHLQMPYLFILNNLGHIEYTYVIEKSKQSRTKNYLELVKKLLSS